MRFSFDPPPKGFVIAKPLQQDAYDPKVLPELEKTGNLIITRKRDGWKLFAVKFKNKVKMYTDGLNEIDERLEHVKQELSIAMPNNSMLAGEGIVDIKGRDNIQKVNSFFHSNTTRALRLQGQIGPIKFMIFTIVYWQNERWIGKPYGEHLTKIQEIASENNLQYVVPVTKLEISFAEAQKLVIKRGWEGLVLYDKNFISSFRLDGKNPERPKGCCKWKPICEDDFIVREWLSSSEDKNRVKEVILLQVDPKTKKEFNCGKLGSFTKSIREQLRRAKYPLVMQVQFEARYPSGKVRNARFVRIRTDKKTKDCVAPKSFS